MTTDTMIRQLRYTAKKHENDKLHTFDTNISLMCTEVADRLEKIEKEKSEIRNKAIEKFAERLIARFCYEPHMSICDSDNLYFGEDIKVIIAEIAESMKGEKE